MRRALLIGLACLAVLSATAQVRMGLSGGGDFGGDMLFRGAIPVEIILNRTLQLRPELAFSQWNNNAILRNPGTERRFQSATIAYLDFPLAGKLKMDLEKWSFYGLMGPQLSYAIRASAVYYEMGRYRQEVINWKEAGLKRLDMGILFGLGIEKNLPSGYGLFVDFRYYLGLVNIHTNSQHVIYNQGKVFSLGFLIPIAKKAGSGSGKPPISPASEVGNENILNW